MKRVAMVFVGLFSVWLFGCGSVVTDGAEDGGGGGIGGAAALADPCSVCGANELCEHDYDSGVGGDCDSCEQVPEMCIGSDDMCTCLGLATYEDNCQAWSCGVDAYGAISVTCDIQGACVF